MKKKNLAITIKSSEKKKQRNRNKQTLFTFTIFIQIYFSIILHSVTAVCFQFLTILLSSFHLSTHCFSFHHSSSFHFVNNTLITSFSNFCHQSQQYFSKIVFHCFFDFVPQFVELVNLSFFPLFSMFFP